MNPLLVMTVTKSPEIQQAYAKLLYQLFQENLVIADYYTGMEAIAASQQIKPDLVLCDFDLQDMTAPMFFNYFTQSNNTTDIPFIILIDEAQEGQILSAPTIKLFEYVSRNNLNAAKLNYAISSSIEKKTLNKKIQEQDQVLKSMKIKDFELDIPNRQFFDTALEKIVARCKRHDLCCAVVVTDVDGFGEVVKTIGRQQAVNILNEVAKRIQKQVRVNDVVASLGSDEFAIILDQINSKEDVKVVVDRLVTNLKKPYELNGRVLELFFSIGVAFFPTDAITFSELFRAANMELYLTKSRGGDGVMFYS